MTATTTIRIDEELRARVAAAAERAGKTPHAFIVDAIAQTVEVSESEAGFSRTADERWSRLLDGGKAVSWSEARAYLQVRAAGGRPRKPAARKPGR